MLRYVASGPFPAATDMGTAGAILGLARPFRADGDHGRRPSYGRGSTGRPLLDRNPILAGITYGLITYVVMNWLVVPLRFDTPLPPKPLSIATQLFAHVVLVGIPTCARSHLRRYQK